MDIENLLHVPEGWNVVPLSLLVDPERGISYGVVQPGQDVTDGVPIVRVADLRHGRVDQDAPMRVAPEIVERYRRTRLIGGEVLLSLVGTVGAVAIAPPELAGWNTARAVAVIPPRADVDARWLAFCLRSPALQALMESWCTTTVQATLNLKEVAQLPIPLPPRNVQEGIVQVLSALEEKIEVNRRTNMTLEELASTLFRSWFVDFDPVTAKRDGKAPVGVPADVLDLFPCHFEDSALGPIPQAWHVVRIGDLAELNARTLSATNVPSEIRYVEISDVHRGNVDNITVYARGSEPSRARRIVRDGDTVVSAVRPERGAYFLCLEPPPNLIVSTGFVVLTPHADHWALVYCAATSDDALDYYELHADGGAYPAMRPEAVNNLRLAMPPGDAICECFSSIVNPLLKCADANRNEAKRLAELRDALLPPLLSGEITLKAAEKTVAEVV